MNPQILYDIFEKVNRYKNQGKDIIKLNVGEPEQKPPKLLLSAITTSLNSGRTNYGPAAGEPQLRKILAKNHQVKPENILIGPGSKFLIYAVLKLLIADCNKEMVIPLPAWSAFSLMAKDLKMKKVKYLITKEKDNWQINKTNLSDKTLILVSPHNPTSMLVNLPIKADCWVIKDCAYEALAFREKKEIVDLDKMIQIHSFSKKFCMTGFRIGYVIARKDIIEKLTRFMQITISCVPSFIQDGVSVLLEKAPNFPRKIAKIYQNRAEIVGKMLAAAHINFVKPEAGFYIFANLNRPAEKFCMELIERGVAVVPGTAFGPYPNHVRISLTEKEDRLKKGIKIMIDSL